MRTLGRRYFASPWHWWEWTGIALLIAAAVCRYQQFRGMRAIELHLEAALGAFADFRAVAVYAQAELGLPGPVVGYYVSASGLVGVLFLLSFRPLGRLFDDVELVLYGIAVMVASCALMVRPVAAALGGGDAFQVLSLIHI